MSTADFYDLLAPFYHLNYGDWSASVARQARELDTILRSRGASPPRTLLDAACGIGTQSLGLAALGYEVTASDISSGAIERARREAAERRLEIAFSVADMRVAFEHHARTFDVVIACDNAVPHLLSDAEILTALRQLLLCTAPGGLCLISVRDYASVERTGVQVRPPIFHQQGDTRWITFQLWEFDGPVYELGIYLVEDGPGTEPRTRVVRSRYYAVLIDTLIELMRGAGFVEVERIDEPFYQPVILGRRPAAG